MKKYIAILLAAMMMLAMLAGCGETNNTGNEAGTEVGSDGRKVAKEQVYRTLYSSEVATMNYLYSTTEIDMVPGVNGTMTLYMSDSHSVLQPNAAESYTVNDDGTVYTFKIRQGQKWYDYTGAEKGNVTAHDWVTAIHWCIEAANDSGNSSSTYHIKNAEAYYEQTAAILAGETPATQLTLEDVGVKAVDDYTLEFTLEMPTPYFLSVLEFGCYFPAAQACLDEFGERFGTDNKTMWYCGPYIMDDFAPQEKHHFVKNENYWDAKNVFITEIDKQYNAEAATLQSTLFLQGEVSDTSVSSDLLAEWQSDAEKSKMITTTMVQTNYSYFWGFNFEPRVLDTDHNEEVNEKWTIAVNNENFRKSIMHGMDRIRALEVSYPTNAQDLLSNTLIPKNFVSLNGKDYTEYGRLPEVAVDYFDEAKAKEYRDKAKAELEPILKAAGYSFPIEIVTQYNGSADWGKECMVIKQQMEELLGADYINWTILNFGSSGFLAGTRRCGNYCMQKLNGGADYMDPDTWYFITEIGNNYCFNYDTTEKYEVNTKTPETLAAFAEYHKMFDEGKNERLDLEKRYNLIADAEAYYLEHAMCIPYRATGGGYTATYMNVFEGPQSACGWSYLSYYGQKIYETAMSQENYNTALAAWQAGN